jgi:hypothetical protein
MRPILGIGALAPSSNGGPLSPIGIVVLVLVGVVFVVSTVVFIMRHR